MDFYSLGFPSLQDSPGEDLAGETVTLNMALSDNRTADILTRSLSMEKKEGEEEPFGFAVFRKDTVPKNHFRNFIKPMPALKKTEIFSYHLVKVK
jgi:hypothetical protein